jgi:hypothetical protein
MILASISPRRTARDPFPWLWPSGRRSADAGPLDWVELGGGARLRPSRARYAPRTHPPYRAVMHHPVNPILDTARDSWDDDWGSALGWAFPCCAVLAYLGEPIPSEWGYRPSVAGPAGDLADGSSYETVEVVTLLGLGTAVGPDGEDPILSLTDPDDIPPDTWRLAGEYALHAARVLIRVADAVPEPDRY